MIRAGNCVKVTGGGCGEAGALRLRSSASGLCSPGVQCLLPTKHLNSSLAGINQSADNLHIFLLVCGLRQVKDPLYLVDVFSGTFC